MRLCNEIEINVHEGNDNVMQFIIKVSLFVFCSLGLTLLSLSAHASCKGCLCPGDPCNLCPLPAMENVPPKTNEPELCARIREKVPPTTAEPGSNEYFPSLDKSVMVCVNEGGDVIRNKQRNAEFPSRFYCKPPQQQLKQH
ncbi:hypothetical protein SAMN05428977_100951 [Nitrosomonas sp. Nm166]|nr:hypothetical protein SAMN05428977_100951 [Nitrosomonas sp. Nm166]